ncbi:MAG: serine protease [Candidatus Poribacteria bacterium]|nr:serine protease [Candidatus Poribacteria bacterium]
MNWDRIVNKIKPHIVKIETQAGDGTGFLLLYNENRTFCGVATALHVVSHADDWQQPIRLRDHSSSQTVLLESNARAILTDWKTDSAVILFNKGEFPLPAEPNTLLPSASIIPVGVEVGWLGFPAVAPYDLCFFSGKVSARQESSNAYLIDGVAINGVSGGPVIHGSTEDGVRIVGAVSAYHANRASGDALPGLLIAQDVTHFHGVTGTIRSIDEANRKKAEFESGELQTNIRN